MMFRQAAWEAAVLPLNYARDGAEMTGAGAGRQEGGVKPPYDALCAMMVGSIIALGTPFSADD
jgi:hypothetical protein